MREVRMTFGEHLEELRRRIFFALLWLVLSAGICFIFGKGLLKWTMGPHMTAIRGAVRDHSISILQSKAEELLRRTRSSPEPAAGGGPGGGWEELFAADQRAARLHASLGQFVRDDLAPRFGVNLEAADADGLALKLSQAILSALSDDTLSVAARSLPDRFRLLEDELRRIGERNKALPLKRLLGVGRNMEDAIRPLDEFNRFLDARRKELALAPPLPAGQKSDSALSELVQKLEAIYSDMLERARVLASEDPKLPIAISYLESFMTYFKVSLVFGLFFAIPLILWELWKFVGAGLYEHEQHYVLVFLPLSVAFFFIGALFGYFSVIPIALEFLAGWGTDIAEMNFTLSNYVGLFFTLTVILGLVFQTPLVMAFLGKIGAVGAPGFRKARKFAVLGAVVFAAVVTPPDPLSWTLVAGPVILLYELGIWIVAVSGKKRVAAPAGKSGKPQGVGV